MYKFAHLADCHLGANRDPVLENLELSAFNRALDLCVQKEVDFILITGDLFHSNVPDMGVVNAAARKMKSIRDLGILIYAIYGSHDYSPNEASMIDVLNSAGLIRKIVEGEVVGNRLRLKFFVDPRTGAKLAGISARKGGLEKGYFDILDREALEREPGFKVFAFHSAISELKPEYLAQMASIPMSLLPRGFDYYAGGHVHQWCKESLPGYRTVAYPGTLFAGYPRDLEQSARGMRRGLFIVSFEEEVESVEFEEVSVCDYAYFEYDVSGKNSVQARRELLETLDGADVKGKLVVVKVRGELSGGKTSDINTNEIKDLLVESGALYVSINRYALTSRERAAIKVTGEDMSAIESRLLSENIGSVKVSSEELKGEKGTKTALELLKILRQEQKLNETKKDYTERIQRAALGVLGLEADFR